MATEYLKSASDAPLEISQNVTESVRDIVDTVRERGDEGFARRTSTASR